MGGARRPVIGVISILAATGCPDAPNAPTTNVNPPPPLVGARDVTHKPLVLATAPLVLESEVAAIPTPYPGTLTFAVDKQKPLLPAQTRKITFFVGRHSTGDAPSAVTAGIRTIRATGFSGVAVGVEHSFVIPSTPLEDLGAVALGGLALMFGVNPWSLTPPGPLSLDVPDKRAGLGELRIVVRENASPGHYAGRLEPAWLSAPCKPPTGARSRSRSFACVTCRRRSIA